MSDKPIVQMHPNQDKMAEIAIQAIQRVVWEELGDRGISQAAVIGALEVVKAEILQDIVDP